MNEANMQAAQSVAPNHSRAGEYIRNIALVAAMGAATVACATQPGNTEVHASGTSPDKTTAVGAAPAAGKFEFNGQVTDGSDAAVGAENDANLYDCGGVKGETYKNADGTDKPFNPDNLISHMNLHPELAKSDSDFWVDIFGEKSMNFLGDKAIGNKQHDDSKAVNVPGVAEGYANFIASQNSAVMKVDALAGNFACKTATGEYKVFPVGPKQLKAGETHLTGIALTRANYEEFVRIVASEGKNLDMVFTQEMNADTDGDGKGDLDVVVVLTKHQMCANNELKLPPAIPSSPEAPTLPPNITTIHRNTPTTPTVTYSVPPNVTTVPPDTKVGPKDNAHLPTNGGIPGQAPTTVETGKPQGEPTPTLGPRTPETAPHTDPTQAPPKEISTTTAPDKGIPNPDLVANEQEN